MESSFVKTNVEEDAVLQSSALEALSHIEKEYSDYIKYVMFSYVEDYESQVYWINSFFHIENKKQENDLPGDINDYFSRFYKHSDTTMLVGDRMDCHINAGVSNKVIINTKDVESEIYKTGSKVFFKKPHNVWISILNIVRKSILELKNSEVNYDVEVGVFSNELNKDQQGKYKLISFPEVILVLRRETNTQSLSKYIKNTVKESLIIRLEENFELLTFYNIKGSYFDKEKKLIYNTIKKDMKKVLLKERFAE